MVKTIFYQRAQLFDVYFYISQYVRFIALFLCRELQDLTSEIQKEREEVGANPVPQSNIVLTFTDLLCEQKRCQKRSKNVENVFTLKKKVCSII